jgi:hypothetical protein
MQQPFLIVSALTVGVLVGGLISVHRADGAASGGITGSSPAAAVKTGDPAAGVTNDLPQPAPLVFSNYFKIASALAEDSLDGVSPSARGISKTVKDDAAAVFPSEVAEQAEALAKGSTNLADARDAFQSLSDSLIKFVSKHSPQGPPFYQFHCPMVDADWLQTNSEVHNPYTGGTCGNLVN